jgi:hypothetical protein
MSNVKVFLCMEAEQYEGVLPPSTDSLVAKMDKVETIETLDKSQ